MKDMNKISEPLDSQGRLAQYRRINALRNAVKIMRKQNTVIKYFKWIALAFAFAWLVHVTRYDYNVQVSHGGTFRIDRLTSKIQAYSFEHKAWTEVSKK